jgi:Tol biopolymer transport system component
MLREKMRYPLVAVVFILFLIFGASQKRGSSLHQFPHLTGKYFGQKVPGNKAELFASGLVSLKGRYEFAPSFSPEGDELLFSAGIPGKPVCVYYTRISDGRWKEPKPVSLSMGAKKEEMEAFFSLDGRHIFFAPYDKGLDVRIWKVDIHEDGWKNPQPLEGNISDESAFFPTSSKKGSLYYFNIAQKKIYKALLEEGVVKESGDAGLEFGGHGFISADERFILVDAAQQDSRGKLDIYVAFRKEDGGWSKPVNLGDEVNTEYNETCPTLSSDGKYLFFSRYNEPGELSNIYWIDSDIIEAVRKSIDIRSVKSEEDFPALTGPYLGQKPPGLTPEIFVPGIISTENLGEAGSSFTKNGEMFLFNRRIPPEEHKTIYFSQEKNGFWTKPSPVPFNSPYADWDFHFAPDGKTMYFSSKRPVDKENTPSKHANIWVTELVDSRWKEPRMLGYPVSTLDSHDCCATLTTDGTIYFFSRREGGLGQSDIYRSRLKDGKYLEVENLGKPINSEHSDYDSFIAPDESYLIFSSNRSGGYGKYNDMYVSFRNVDGTWTEPKNLGYEFRDSGINCVTLDNKYLFYTCGRTGEDDIYWVDAKIIEDLNPNNYRRNRNSCGTVDSYPVPGSCTIFSASFGNTVLYGNNEDYRIPKTYYWAEPSGEKTYGGVFLGFDNFFPQGGMNEKGLAFDFNALPEASLKPHPELPDHGDIIKKIHQTCATVEEAITLIKKHNWGSSLRWQVLLADATGDAVVVSAGPDKELAFTRKPRRDGFLVSTNFNRANPKNTYRGGYPCWRYNKAVEMLEKIKDEKDLTVDYFKSILDACHVEGPVSNTLYSNVFDLKNGVIYLYYWHQFYETAVLKVAEEIAKNKPPTRIKELFSQETVKRADDEFQKYKKKNRLSTRSSKNE